MKINQHYNGTIIGGIFTTISFLLTFTFIVPMLSVIPGSFIEVFVSSIINNEPYSNVGKATIGILLIILFTSILLIVISAIKVSLSNKKVVAIMIFEYFVIHALGFYIYWGISLKFKLDGQLIFGAVTSFPISSFGFVILGILIDCMKIFQRRRN